MHTNSEDRPVCKTINQSDTSDANYAQVRSEILQYKWA